MNDLKEWRSKDEEKWMKNGILTQWYDRRFLFCVFVAVVIKLTNNKWT